MQHDTATLAVNVCVSGRLTQRGNPVPFERLEDTIQTARLELSGGCTEMAMYLSVTAIIGREDESPFYKEDFSDFLEANGYTFAGEVWEEPNTDWY